MENVFEQTRKYSCIMDTLPTELVVSVVGFVQLDTLVFGVGLTCAYFRDIVLDHFVKKQAKRRMGDCDRGSFTEEIDKVTVSNYYGDAQVKKVLVEKLEGKLDNITTTLGRRVGGKKDGVWASNCSLDEPYNNFEIWYRKGAVIYIEDGGFYATLCADTEKGTIYYKFFGTIRTCRGEKHRVFYKVVDSSTQLEKGLSHCCEMHMGELPPLPTRE
ncbi:hypothetical protein GMAR_ORF278 [Golden Marseillevirus]|uniref:hypothetical protein n=1 Tax=Golden Marseillevirus TaxID=1720526 RepID=UPI000877AED2|nr:hypothetical protein GMAR_ORF278 [Golden Marseillevirus]ALX27652.1 hypothetical protein GMAR_ORF278 [Golden Marseillevirus]